MLFDKAGFLAFVALSTGVLAQWEDYSEGGLYSREAAIDYDAYIQGYISGLTRRQDKAAADKVQLDAAKLNEAKTASAQAKQDGKIMAADKAKLAANEKKLEKVRSQIKALRADEGKFQDDKDKLAELATKIASLTNEKKKLKDEKLRLEKQFKEAATDQKAQLATVQKDLTRRAFLEEYFDEYY